MWHTTKLSRLIPPTLTTSLWRTRPSLTCPRLLHNLRSPMWFARKALEERSVYLTPPPSLKRFRFFPRAIKTRCVHDYLTSIITSPGNTSATNLYNYTTRATLPPQTTTTNNRLTPENEVFAEPVAHLTRVPPQGLYKRPGLSPSAIIQFLRRAERA